MIEFLVQPEHSDDVSPMDSKNLLRKWPSVSAAAAMLLGLQRTDANTPEGSVTVEPQKGEPYEPLILKPSQGKVIPEHLFAGHRSHSSHSSHSSGSSGGGHASHASHSSGTSSGGYVPPAPNYVPTVPRTYPTTTPKPRAAVAPKPTAEQLIRIDLTNGAVIYGTLLTKSAAGITLKCLDQKSYKIPRLILASSTIVALSLPPEQ